MAVTLLEHGEWLLDRGRVRDAHELVEQAHTMFEVMGARPWLDRIAAKAEVLGA